MSIQLVLSDDWELRGDGSGNSPRALQFDTARRLMSLYEAHGIRGTFNVEVMQQLEHRKWASRYPHLGQLATEWDDCVCEMYRRGHDVELHVHPQWLDSVYDGEHWLLQDNWGIVDFAESDARRMLFACRNYLHGLLQPLDANYRCRSFRSGSWSLAPSPFMLRLLTELGLTFDMSLGHGLHYKLAMVQLDYRNLDEPFLPFYPQMDDARFMAAERSPIIYVPTHSRRVGPLDRMRSRLEGKVAAIERRLGRHEQSQYLCPAAFPIADAGPARKAQNPWLKPDTMGTSFSRWAENLVCVRHAVTDLSLLTYSEMRAAAKDARRRAAASGWREVPIVFENHTKGLGNMNPLKRFCSLLDGCRDIQVITARQLADRLEAGDFPVRKAPSTVSLSLSSAQKDSAAERESRRISA